MLYFVCGGHTWQCSGVTEHIFSNPWALSGVCVFRRVHQGCWELKPGQPHARQIHCTILLVLKLQCLISIFTTTLQARYSYHSYFDNGELASVTCPQLQLVRRQSYELVLSLRKAQIPQNIMTKQKYDGKSYSRVPGTSLRILGKLVWDYSQ